MRYLAFLSLFLPGAALAQPAGPYGPGPCPMGASSCVVTPTGGTTSRALAAWAGDVIWAKFQGVKCDGSSDDTSALTTLFLAASNVKIILPSGTCLTSASLILPHSNVEIEGAGIGQTVIKNTHGSGLGPVIEVGNISGFVASNDVFIHDLTIDGNQSAVGTRRDVGVWTTPGSLRTKVWNIEVKNAGDNGIEMAGSYGDFGYNYVHDNWTNGIYAIGYWNGITALLSEYNIIHHNVVSTNSIGTTSWDGIDIDPMSSYNTIDTNTVIGNDIILFETGINSPTSSGNAITNNLIIDSTENCIDVTGYQNFWQVVGNKCYNTVGHGVFLNTSGNHGLIAGNVISGPTQHGIILDNPSAYTGTMSYIDVANNQINNPSLNIGSFDGIMVKVGFNITVRDNHISDTRGPVAMKYAIETATATPNATVVVEANDVVTGTAGIMNVLTSQTVRYNAGYNTPYTQTITASSGTITQTSGSIYLDLDVYGAGGPGGTGATCGAAASCSGGAGGGGGGHVRVFHARWADLGVTSCTAAVAQPVAAGGSVAGATTVTCGSFVWSAASGGAGQAGASAAASGGGGGGGILASGSSGSAGSGGAGGNALAGTGAGGSGAVGTSGNNLMGSGGAGAANAGAGVNGSLASGSATGGGSGGGCNAGVATAGSLGGGNETGVSATGGAGIAGHGSPGTGGGGSASSTGTASTAGAGGLPGAGGGGGGASCNGTGTAGTGGTSGGGLVWATQSS